MKKKPADQFSKRETFISIDVTEPGGEAILTMPDRQVLKQYLFNDAVPHVLASLQGPSI